MTETVVCEKHGEYESELVNLYGMTIRTTCPKCDAEEDASGMAGMSEIDKTRRTAKMKEQNIEPEYYDATLDNYIADTSELVQNLQAARNMAAGKQKKIIMVGSNGTGKTRLACSVLNAIGGNIYTMFEISAMIRQSYTPKAERTELEILDKLARDPCLVIDEIGRTKGSDTEANWLSYIIDKRHVRGLPLIMISNKHVRKDCPEGTGCSGCLENYLGEDILSRWREGGMILRFTGRDFRGQKSLDRTRR